MKRLNSMDNTVLHVFNDDARPIYKTMLDMNCGFPVICVEIMPWKKYESEEAIIWSLDEDSYENESGILFIQGNSIDDMVEILKRSIGNIESVVTIIDRTKTTFLHSLSSKRVLNLYKALIDICDDLEIKCPLLIFTNSRHLDGKRGVHMKVLDEEDNYKGDLVCLKGQGYYYMLQSLAHELRHMYQQKNDENYFKNYITPEEGGLANTYSDEEIDADAYAALVVEQMTGQDGLKYVFDDMIEYNHPKWINLKFFIRTQMNKIKRQEGVFKDKRPAI